jgi:hypothetical protein
MLTSLERVLKETHVLCPFVKIDYSPNVGFSYHRLNMDLVRSQKFIWAPVYSCTHWLRPRIFPPPAFGLIY